MADDKVRDLAERCVANWGDKGPFTACDNLERILRAELKPLLDAAQGIVADLEKIGLECGVFVDGPTLRRLAAELRGWRKEEK